MKLLTAHEMRDAEQRKRLGLVKKAGRTLAVGFQWTGHDDPSGKGRAAQRRQRQMQRGILPARCMRCSQLMPNRPMLVCDECLEKKFSLTTSHPSSQS